MSAFTLPPCAENISEQTLSDWHDGLLSVTEERRLRDHVPNCAACRYRGEGFATVARALHQQMIPDLHARIWRGMQAQVWRRPAHMLQRGATFGIISAVLVVALVAIFAFLPRHGTTPPTSFAPTATHSGTATAPPSELTPQQAWGTVGIHTLSIDTKKYGIQGLLPGGAGVVGSTYTQTSQTNPADIRVAIVYATTSDGKIHTITVGAWTHASVATDGRYIAWLGGYNPMGGPGDNHQTLAYYDLQTGQSHIILDADGNYFDSFHPIVVTHGHLLLTKEEIKPEAPTFGLTVIDLATGAQQTIPQNVDTFAASWPYALVTDHNNGQIKTSPYPVVLINLLTGQQRDVTALVGYLDGKNQSLALDGTTIFAAYPHTGGATAATEGYYQIDHADLPGSQPRLLFLTPLSDFYNEDAGFDEADARLLVVMGKDISFSIWDRVLQRPIAIGQGIQISNGVVAYSTSQSGPNVLLLQDESDFRT